VEPRNDLGRPVFDGIEPVRAGEMARERGLRFIGLSEVYPFNDWNDDRRAAVGSLIETAEAAGAETVSFIPRVDGREGDGAERAKTLRAVLAEILPMLHGTGSSAWWTHRLREVLYQILERGDAGNRRPGRRRSPWNRS
jgi:2-keto-myo-inositol isomerase